MPKAFISYSWDDEEHKQWVRDFASRLRKDGIESVLDQWYVVPGDRLPTFMETAVRESDYVLIICTPRYKKKANRREGGVGYEEDIISGEVLTTRFERKFIPILRRGDLTDSAPTWLVGKYYIDLRGNPYSEASYRELVETLHGVREDAPPVIPPSAHPPVGSKGTTSTKDVTSVHAPPGPPVETEDHEELLSVPQEISKQFQKIRLEVHKTRNGYFQDEKEIVTFVGRQLYSGSDFRGPCQVYEKENGTLIFYYEFFGKPVYTTYRDLNEAKRARSNGYPVHDRSAIEGAAEALGFELDLDEREI